MNLVSTVTSSKRWAISDTNLQSIQGIQKGWYRFLVQGFITGVVQSVSMTGPGEGNDRSRPWHVHFQLCGLLDGSLEGSIVTVHKEEHRLALHPCSPVLVCLLPHGHDAGSVLKTVSTPLLARLQSHSTVTKSIRDSSSPLANPPVWSATRSLA